MEDYLILLIVAVVSWFIGLLLFIGVPVAIVKLFHIEANLWILGLASALIWFVVSFIYLIIPK